MAAQTTVTDSVAFADMWERFSPNIRAYALRHVDRVEVDDVVSETFLVAWRRWRAVPADQLPWLLVTARNIVRNSQRTLNRRARLDDALRRLEYVARQAPAAEIVAAERHGVLLALARLSEKEREALLLTAWDGLSAREAARVGGCTVATFNVRLHRARAHLRALAETEPQPSPHAPVVRSTP